MSRKKLNVGKTNERNDSRIVNIHFFSVLEYQFLFIWARGWTRLPNSFSRSYFFQRVNKSQHNPMHS